MRAERRTPGPHPLVDLCEGEKLINQPADLGIDPGSTSDLNTLRLHKPGLGIAALTRFLKRDVKRHSVTAHCYNPSVQMVTRWRQVDGRRVTTPMRYAMAIVPTPTPRSSPALSDRVTSRYIKKVMKLSSTVGRVAAWTVAFVPATAAATGAKSAKLGRMAFTHKVYEMKLEEITLIVTDQERRKEHRQVSVFSPAELMADGG
jgi:hypothetical protein